MRTRAPLTRSVAAAAALLLCVPAFTVGAARDLISEQITLKAAERGLSRTTHRLFRDWLYDSEDQYVTFTLDAGVRYTLIGACDIDCTDLDFELLNPGGVTVAHDNLPDDTPMVSVTPSRRGSYQLRATMYACHIEPCEWGVRVYRR